MADVIADLIARIEARLGREGVKVTLGEIEQQVRREWGGRYNWVQAGGAAVRVVRDQQIVAAVLRGESAESVGKRFGVSARRVRQIVSGGGPR